MTIENTSPNQPNKRKQALLRVLRATKSLSARTTLYASALGSVALMYGANLPPELATLTGVIGANALTSIIERIADGESVADDEIRNQVKAAIAESDIAELLTTDTFQAEIARLIRQQHLFRAAIERQEYEIVDRLTEQATQYEVLFNELQDDIWAIHSELQNLATRDQGQEILNLLQHLVNLLEARQDIVEPVMESDSNSNPQSLPSPTSQSAPSLYILHLSDIHLGTKSEARRYSTQLQADLKNELGVKQLDYLIISGDVADRATPSEFEAATELIDGLLERFKLDDYSRTVIVPGNHDLNWELSEQAYRFVPKSKLLDPLVEGRYIPAGDAGILLRDDNHYQQKFINFSQYFYEKVLGGPYPLDAADQAILYPYPKDCLLFLGLNSAWELDHHYTRRASINPDALANALNQVMDNDYEGWLKIAVWHHPITGPGAMNADFMEQLAVQGFQLALHGHIHQAIEDYHKYDDKRGISLIGAGTFGAPVKEQMSGIPLQYNLLVLDPAAQVLTVQTRKKEKPDGAWAADARWGDRNNPVPRYEIKIKGYRHPGLTS